MSGLVFQMNGVLGHDSALGRGQPLLMNHAPGAGSIVGSVVQLSEIYKNGQVHHRLYHNERNSLLTLNQHLPHTSLIAEMTHNRIYCQLTGNRI